MCAEKADLLTIPNKHMLSTDPAYFFKPGFLETLKTQTGLYDTVPRL